MARIPHRLFMYWAVGFENAPETVQIAVRSWRVMNPSFDLVLLDDESLADWVGDRDRLRLWDQFDLQKKSDLIRMYLIKEHGGFWADATLACTRPLNDWLNLETQSGVVFLRTPRGKNRLLQTFFLGGVPGSVFITVWLRELERLLVSGAKPMTNGTMKRWRRRWPLLWANPLMTSIWSVPFVIKRTGYPYLLPHYVANRLIFTSPQLAMRYLSTPVYFAGEALHLENRRSGTDAFTDLLISDDFPLWKLTWRTGINPSYWANVMSLLSDYLDQARPHGR